MRSGSISPDKEDHPAPDATVERWRVVYGVGRDDSAVRRRRLAAVRRNCRRIIWQFPRLCIGSQQRGQ
jgi:hypothetical protein